MAAMAAGVDSNADLTLTAGSATNTFFVTGASVNTPRVWNGTIFYSLGAATPEPGSLVLLALGGTLVIVKRRRK